MLTPGPFELMILLALGVLLFGGQLPKIMKTLGRGVVEFKKGIQGIEDHVQPPAYRAALPEEHDRGLDDLEEVPKFHSEEPSGRSNNGAPKFQAADQAEDPSADDVPKFQSQS